jgi:hypothetical protein
MRSLRRQIHSNVTVTKNSGLDRHQCCNTINYILMVVRVTSSGLADSDTDSNTDCTNSRRQQTAGK